MSDTGANEQNGVASHGTPQLWYMAEAIGTGGVLRRYVPQHPSWCLRIGDEVIRAWRGRRDLHPFEIERLSYVFRDTQARQQGLLAKRKPKKGQGLLCKRIVEHGISRWEPEDVPLLPSLLASTMGSA